jgi:2-polyprenyl-6-methoxyphenol hydroxylase-like FAD-dependent oxidoreductase
LNPTGHDCDVAVVGAGPGGATGALAAARAGLTVVLFEPQTGDFDKPCGEGLLPQGVDVLRALGLSRVIDEGLPFAGIRYATPGCAPLDVPFASPGITIARPRLQAALHDALRREPRVRWVRARAETERSPDGVLVRTSDGDCHARLLVAADGAFGTSASWLARSEPEPRPRLGLRLRCRAARPLDRVEVHIGRGPEIYLTPLAGGVINAAALVSDPPSDVRGAEALFEHAIALYPEARARLGETLTRAAARRLGAPQRRVVAGRATFVVGDAGGTVDPILGCGVSIALTSGLRAAHAAAALVHGARASDIERDYARQHRRDVGARQRLATTLRWISERPGAARIAIAAGRRVPGWTNVLVRIAGGVSRTVTFDVPGPLPTAASPARARAGG